MQSKLADCIKVKKDPRPPTFLPNITNLPYLSSSHITVATVSAQACGCDINALQVNNGALGVDMIVSFGGGNSSLHFASYVVSLDTPIRVEIVCKDESVTRILILYRFRGFRGEVSILRS